ncbi:MFS transporter [Clostridium sp.]|uniref:MFS transporter n=1 Tax=Clostridium sp. TaxID=1506 RepID=UPI0025874CE6|nr:MFS transporter [Clostridium sp.]MDF2502822.1 drug resistance transporter, EmrB/QacA subfamily [Clostridium sp.]
MNKENKSLNKNRWLILLTVVLMTFMCCLDTSIVNVALPVMSKKLNVTMGSIEWVITSYLIIISAMILIFGRLGDIKGKTKIFKFGIALFTIGSFLCGMTNSLLVLVLARIIQGVGAAATMSNSQGIITHVFPANERGRALGISGTFVALGTMVGPPIGGLIVSAFSWEYIFLINVPIGIMTFIISMKIFPRANNILKEKLDARGSILFIIGIVSLFGSLVQGQNIGYKHPIIIIGFIIAIISLVSFIIMEKVVKIPLLELSIFKNNLFSLSIFCGFVSFIAISAVTIILPFYLQDVLKLSPAITGIFMMISPLILAVVSPVSGYLSDKIGSEFLTFLGLILMSIGFVFMATLNENSSLLIVAAFIAIMTVGNGMFQSPNNSLVMSTVAKNKLGIAGSVNALVRNLGMVLGVSLSTLILYNRMSYKIGYRVVNYVEGRNDVFIYGMRYVFIGSAVMCAIGAIITAIRLYSSKENNEEVIEEY